MLAKKIKKLIVLSIYISFIVLFSSLDGLSQPKTLIIAHGGEPETLFPSTASQATIDRIYSIMEPLVYLDPEGKPIPVLATRWEIVDGKKWRFHLRKGVVFHNGEKFNAEDVAFSIDYTKDPKNKVDRMGMVKGYTYEIIDEYTIDIINEAGTLDPILPESWYCIHILPKDTLLEMGHSKFSRGPIGTGPFQFVEWKGGEHIILKAFDKYWGGKPKIDRVIFKTIPETATRVIGLKRGDLDIIIGVPPTEIKSIQEDQNLEIRQKSSLCAFHLQFRCDIPPFKDNINLRKAVAHAIDSEAICKQILGGFAKPEGSVTPVLAFGYNKNVKPYKYDPKLAKEYLIQSGYKGEEIKMVSSGGRYFMDNDVNAAMAGYLKAIGINVNLTILDSATYISKYFAHTIEPMFLMYWCDNSGDGVENLFDICHKDSRHHFLDKGGIPELSKLIDIARTSSDRNIRREAIEKANQLIHDYYYWGMVYVLGKTYGVRKNIKWNARVDEIIYVSNQDDKL